jgi:hypothetical protein
MRQMNWSAGWIVLWTVLAPVVGGIGMLVVFGTLGYLLFLIASFFERRSRRCK